ncbi:hypothetical protein PHISP_03510 [Aspergillus sp. HF37]|nr:hypothetical protein PHISP_03510 [Aspergillus sp. HF37]
MSGKNNNKEKKPPLTHFLCVPLVNSASLPQLESSLSSFREAIPPHPHQHPHPRAPTQPLIPDGAVRPIGTLHLTLGVMSLPTRERLDEALEFFQSLDLASMAREAETTARTPKRGRQSGIEGSGCPESAIEPTSTASAPQPFRISLESLHALPRARAATVLHASPVDASSRLYPFCEMLRDMFLEAGFLVGEIKQKNKNEDKTAQKTESANPSQESGEQQSSLQELPVDIAPEPGHSQLTNPLKPAPSPKPRPLLLHATVVNTIYVKGRQRGGPPNRNSGGRNRNHRTTRYSFDARDMLARYRDYYLDSLRTEPRATRVGPLAPAGQTETKEEDEEAGDASSDNENQTKASSDNKASDTQAAVKYPFLWAKDFPLESVCICEMGAKKLDPENDATGLNGRLREKYTVIAERSLDFGSAQQTSQAPG